MIDTFRGEYAFLSNFYSAPVEFNGRLWASVEHAFQAAKVDDETAEQIYLSSNPTVAKRLGRTGIMRPDWDAIKDDVMLACLRSKFQRNPTLHSRLMSTGNEELIEGNYWHDNYWGVCSCAKCKEKGLTGLNKLGTMLMQVRKENIGV